jgi:hypothetical protein
MRFLSYKTYPTSHLILSLFLFHFTHLGIHAVWRYLVPHPPLSLTLIFSQESPFCCVALGSNALLCTVPTSPVVLIKLSYLGCLEKMPDGEIDCASSKILVSEVFLDFL